MSNEFILDFISKQDFEKHVTDTINQYKESLKSISLKKFNRNIVDPIKLIFDKNIFNKEFKEIIELEISRQRDKTNNNVIGYFHQNIFKYIKNCNVPSQGWDVIFQGDENTYYVEMKNKHNTMNSVAASGIYMKMQNHLLNYDNEEKSICALVEVIAKCSQNIPWVMKIENQKLIGNRRIKRISIDKFYEIVTGNKDSFKNLCLQLPITLEKLVSENVFLKVEKDTVFEELSKISNDIVLALYKLAFSTYEGFEF
ncbi:Eco47II family restriction endonuclease [Mycoplasma capricolum]|uniref:Eco47II restriction endonuclease n=1 Tax=Mycoplasma capricolum subsp. capripneumoniae 87001 TaxID=1124992 RepID=A0A9N7G757_MYCCC|nr:Eco47II family restriction endonuclease [Mycoplasma capricolum]AJK51242.1 Eco47II restriction endonuclease [Mycoplasma capricolum subsp. capripneumoniae 87001]AQU77376.1 restriction endonuclease [Mycoplasma capricolum subsp. capripneumoniae]QIN42910.1 Eco47II family restriction endonuclease [Mycoplasma capricolum subsp. capripneumoniae]QIN46339.1 Eco47II family restriction endonuclease [Mycoplasma capricolum subsp. capripneumoniae]QIN47028.1 Eco47II family restriction endonuclease [Mycoplas